MADSWFLTQNVFEDGTLTADEEAAGFPAANVTDWRGLNGATVYRWKTTATTSFKHITVDLGAGNTDNPDTIVFAGHNLNTAGTANCYVQSSTDNFAAVTVTEKQVNISDDKAHVETFTPSGSFRYWRFRINDPGPFSEVPQIGIVTLGKRLEFEAGFGTKPGLDIYGERFEGSRSVNRNGSPIGGNLRAATRTFALDISNPGMTTTNFYDKAAPNFNTTFHDHVQQMKPFWYAWNLDTDSRGVWLCSVDGYQQPFEFVTTRRSLRITLNAVVEV